MIQKFVISYKNSHILHDFRRGVRADEFAMTIDRILVSAMSFA